MYIQPGQGYFWRSSQSLEINFMKFLFFVNVSAIKLDRIQPLLLKYLFSHVKL